MAKLLPGIISKKSAPELPPLAKAEKVSFDAFDAFRAAQSGLSESNEIAAEYAENQAASIAYAQAQIDAANERIAKNDALAAKLAEFTG